MKDHRPSGPRSYFLLTDRLGFGHWNKGDRELAKVLWGDASVTRRIGGPFSDSDIDARLEHQVSMLVGSGVQYWPVFLLEDNDLVGCAGLRPYGSDERILEMGVHLRERYQGLGLAQEAARAVIGFAFETLRLKGLFTGHHPENAASERLLKRLGFRFTHEELYPPTGLMHPSYLLMNPEDRS